MKAYVIKRDDGQYFKDQLTSGLRFVYCIYDAEIYSKILGAESTMQWIIDNEWRYKLTKENLKVVPIEITECEDVSNN